MGVEFCDRIESGGASCCEVIYMGIEPSADLIPFNVKSYNYLPRWYLVDKHNKDSQLPEIYKDETNELDRSLISWKFTFENSH